MWSHRVGGPGGAARKLPWRRIKLVGLQPRVQRRVAFRRGSRRGGPARPRAPRPTRATARRRARSRCRADGLRSWAYRRRPCGSGKTCGELLRSKATVGSLLVTRVLGRGYAFRYRWPDVDLEPASTVATCAVAFAAPQRAGLEGSSAGSPARRLGALATPLAALPQAGSARICRSRRSRPDSRRRVPVARARGRPAAAAAAPRPARSKTGRPRTPAG